MKNQNTTVFFLDLYLVGVKNMRFGIRLETKKTPKEFIICTGAIFENVRQYKAIHFVTNAVF